MPTDLSAVRCRLATRVTLRQLPSPSSFVQFLSRSLIHFRSRRDRGLRPLFGFAPKQTKGSSAWRTTYIVLQTQDLGFSYVYVSCHRSGPCPSPYTLLCPNFIAPLPCRARSACFRVPANSVTVLEVGSQAGNQTGILFLFCKRFGGVFYIATLICFLSCVFSCFIT